MFIARMFIGRMFIGRMRALLLAACALAGHAGTAAAAGIDPACDAPAGATVLSAAARTATDARAYWLDRQRIQWPGKPRDARYRLLASARGALVAEPGGRAAGADAAFPLRVSGEALPAALRARFGFVGDGVALSPDDRAVARLPELLAGQLLLVQEDAAGRVVDATSLQHPGALDDLYAPAQEVDGLGATVASGSTTFRLWAPTARAVALCLYPDGAAPALASAPMRRDARTGTWSSARDGDLSGRYYTYLVDVFVPGVGVVRNRVTDPYSTSLAADSTRSQVADLDAPALKPPGWDASRAPERLAAQTDMVIYELHVRDFSRDDATVPPAHRGRYLAFTEMDSAGMRHLRALSDAGLTDVHLLPVFDFATVPETGCATPAIPRAAPDSEAQQAAAMAVAARDCFNWGYDPHHFNAPEGSYASDARDGAARILEFRRMVMALHGIGLRVGMDVVYNHTTASGQAPKSVLDRIVPGYYHRLDATGKVERSTCCDNTATEHAMMAKLMIDSAVLWARHYRIDSFRFDLMGHQPRAAMEALRARVNAATGRDVQLIGEGWNFGEVAGGARFVQASQLSLNGSGIGTFSDRARDAIRGGGPADRGGALLKDQGYVNGLVYAPNAAADAARPRADLLHAADLVRVGLAGSLRDFPLVDHAGRATTLHGIDYKGQPAGYASEPAEVVNYVENHDNQTLFDLDAFKLPRDTSREDRARVQVLAMALNAFSQGVAYFHAGIDTLRSKSMDRNSFDSGDWFNRIDWTYRDNFFGTGLPPKQDNGADYPLLRPLLADARIRPDAAAIAFARDAFRDLLRIRASTTLLRLRSAGEIRQRLSFPNSGPAQDPLVMAGHLDGGARDGKVPDGARFRELLYLVNVGTAAQALTLPEHRGKRWVLHPVHRAPGAADPRPARAARHDPATGRFTVPARTALVYVVE